MLLNIFYGIISTMIENQVYSGRFRIVFKINLTLGSCVILEKKSYGFKEQNGITSCWAYILKRFTSIIYSIFKILNT